jgi:hypothetical protein
LNSDGNNCLNGNQSSGGSSCGCEALGVFLLLLLVPILVLFVLIWVCRYLCCASYKHYCPRCLNLIGTGYTIKVP